MSDKRSKAIVRLMRQVEQQQATIDNLTKCVKELRRALAASDDDADTWPVWKESDAALREAGKEGGE